MDCGGGTSFVHNQAHQSSGLSRDCPHGTSRRAIPLAGFGNQAAAMGLGACGDHQSRPGASVRPRGHCQDERGVAALGTRQRLRMVSHLETVFPGLRGSVYQITSPQSDAYNCIAWAAGPANAHSWWWPFGDPAKTYWPPQMPREDTVKAFRQLFASLQYAVCDHDALEPGFEKVALFADGLGVPLHAARQLS